MRLHRLVMTAVGPYAGTEQIDFDRFGPSGRFLLTGPTGSGKSTIIDAIVFALYGDVSGEKESSKDRIRSTLADPATETVVELVFSTPSGVYRVRRTPVYWRPKRRGEGLTQQNPTVKLWRLTQVDGQAVDEPVTRVEEAAAEIERAVGLRRSQFTQTVVLPQGKFARFLRSTSDERHVLLRDVFGTGVYDDLQKRLVSQAHDATVRVTTARTTLRARAGSAAPVLDGVDQDAATGTALLELVDTAEPSRATLDELTQAATAAAGAQVTNADERLTAAERAYASAGEELEAARALRSRLDRRQLLLAEQETLARREEDDAAQAARLAAAERAERVAGADAAERRARDRAAAAVGRVTTPGEPAHSSATASLGDLGSTVEGLAHDLREHLAAGTEPGDDVNPYPLEEAARTTRTEQGALASLVEVEAGLAGREAALAERADGLDRVAQELDTRATQIAERPAARDRLETAVEVARTAAAGLPALEVAREAAHAQAAAAHLAEELGDRLGAATTQATEAGRRAAAAGEEVARLRRLWISATAGSLAGELADGTPCPVCGSTTHPAPALPGAEGATRAQVEVAEETLRQTSEALAEAAQVRDRLQTELGRARADAAGLGAGAADAALAAAEARVVEAGTEAEPETRLTEELRGFDAVTRDLQDALARDREQLAGTRTLLGTDRQALVTDREACAEAHGSAPTVRARWEELGAHANAVDAAAQAVRLAMAEVSACARAGGDLTRTLLEQHFSSVAQARESRLGTRELTVLRERVQAAATERARVRAALASEDLAGLTGHEEVDVEACAQEATRADAARTAAVEAREQARARETQVRTTVQDVLAAAREWEEAATGSAALLRVSSLVAGSNTAGTDLSTWVLLERFEEVLVFANERLAQMSHGRYELVRVDDEAASRARRKGLGLAVMDHLGGDQARDPRTLSGGETFYVSLSLALALADVVAAESGGIGLDTLFVDEGFSSLDPATLEAVMAEIEKLRSGGRTVGIVSHVEELRRQVPDRIEVRRAPVGSTLHLQAS